MIEVDDVILHQLRAGDQVAHQARVIGYFDLQCILHRPYRGEGVDHGTYGTDPLQPVPRLARVAVADHQFQAPEHGAGTPGVGDYTTFHLGLHPKMSFNSRYRINYNTRHI